MRNHWLYCQRWSDNRFDTSWIRTYPHHELKRFESWTGMERTESWTETNWSYTEINWILYWNRWEWFNEFSLLTEQWNPIFKNKNSNIKLYNKWCHIQKFHGLTSIRLSKHPDFDYPANDGIWNLNSILF